MKNYIRGFTLLELLIVIAIIAIIAVVAFVALDPQTRFQDARDSARNTDVDALVSSIKLAQVDNNGIYTYGVTNDTSAAAIVNGTNYMISSATTTTGCNVTCTDATIAAADDCVYLSSLVDQGYIASLPIAPSGSTAYSSTYTGYVFRRNTNNSVTITACESENSPTITISR